MKKVPKESVVRKAEDEVVQLGFARRRRRPLTPFPSAAGWANRGGYLVPGDSDENL